MTPLKLSAALVLLFPVAANAHEIVHMGHAHQHASDCGHQAVEHEGHVDYLHDGHLHMAHGDHADEHSLAVSSNHPANEALVQRVEHSGHAHKAGMDDHAMVQHGDHFDYVHDGRLHFAHLDHVDDHGAIALVK